MEYLAKIADMLLKASKCSESGIYIEHINNVATLKCFEMFI